MADLQATYGIELAVEGTAATEDAAKALEQLREKISADSAALREMQATLRRLQQGGLAPTAAQFKQLRDSISAKKLELAQSSQALLKMKGAFDGLGPSVNAAKKAQDAQRDALKKLAGDIGVAEPALGGLQLSALAAAGPVGALAAVFAVVTGAVLVASVALTKFGIAAADARRNEVLLIQAAGTHVWSQYGLAASRAGDLTEQGARAIQGAVDRVAATTAIGRDRIAGFAEELLKARVQGKDLETALKAVSTAASVGKESGLVQQFAFLRYTGQSVDRLAGLVQDKFGGIVKRQMLGLDVQVTKLREDWSKLWKGVNVEPFLEAVHKVLGLFSTSTTTGYILKGLIQHLFPEGAARTFGDVAAMALKRLLTGALYATIGVLTLRNKILDLKDWIDKTFSVDSVKVFGQTLLDFIPGLKFFSDLGDPAKFGGQGITDGIKQGIEAGKGGVLDSIEDLAKSTIGKFREKLRIFSPSRVFFDAGFQLPMGEVVGIRKGMPAVERAVDALGDASAPQEVRARPSSALAPAAASQRPVTITVPVNVGGIHVGAGGAKDNQSTLDDLEQKLAGVFERAAQRLTAPLEAAT